jgi:hypothetical protein
LIELAQEAVECQGFSEYDKEILSSHHLTVLFLVISLSSLTVNTLRSVNVFIIKYCIKYKVLHFGRERVVANIINHVKATYPLTQETLFV